MAKKLNKDELNNVSGGCGGDNGNTSEIHMLTALMFIIAIMKDAKKVLSIQMQF